MLGKHSQLRTSTLIHYKFLQSQSSVTYSAHRINATNDQNHYCIPIPNPDVTSLNKLINDHSKLGNLASAAKLFDEMPERDVASWNSIMSSYARNDLYNEVLRIFSEMRLHGFRPNHTSISTALSACAKLGALEQGEQIHGLSIKTRSSANVFVGTSLITVYANCGASDSLFRVFDGIEYPNVASWNALISGYVWNHCIEDARRVFEQMPSRNVVSWTAMISGYIEVKKVSSAFELFNMMPAKNSVSWCVMIGGLICNGQYIEAIKLFGEMISKGDQATAPVVNRVISAYSGLKDIGGGRNIHGYTVKCGHHHCESIEASLVWMYCECLDIEEAQLEFEKMERKYVGSWNTLICACINKKKVEEARNLFNGMAQRDKISWNSMINGYLKHNRIDDALELFSMMLEPTVEATTALMSSFIENGRLDEARNLFRRMPRKDVTACTTMLFGYVKEGLLDKALDLFRKMPERSIVTYNIMISGFLQDGKVAEAYKLFNESPLHDATSWNGFIIGLVQNGLIDQAFLMYKKMVSSNINPSESVIASLVGSSSRLSKMVHGHQVHTVAMKLGLDSRLVVQNSLITMYSKCGDMLLAGQVFKEMGDQDVVSWNAIIYGHALNSLAENAIQMFENMKGTSIIPDAITFLSVLSACSYANLLEKAQLFFDSMRRDYRIEPKLGHYACMIDLLCRKGMIEEAKDLIDLMPFEPDSSVWTSLLSSCRANHNDKLAKHAANQLFTCNPSDRMPYLHLINLYGSTGRWNEIENLRNQMKNIRTGKKPGCSWI